ncbi:MAG: 50S ribosomal protein L20 [Acidobacteria bacterium]|nr:50S ribosomal protein L20 [Acidobacteriota bacterium]
MPRVKRGPKRVQRRKRLLKLTKGYYGTRSKHHRHAKEAMAKALNYAYRDRRARKREFRSLWIIRINAASNGYGLSYSRFIQGLKKAGLDLNRKVLAELAVKDPGTFGRLVETARGALAA